jgi:hypothetical protein
MTSVDRLDFSLSLKTNSQAKGARTNFFHEVANPRAFVRCSPRWYVKPRHEDDTRVHLLSLQLLKPTSSHDVVDTA